jgi:hypothetical protein
MFFLAWVCFGQRLSRSFAKAGEILTGSGPGLEKLLRNAIADGDEEKAISLYFVSVDGSTGQERPALMHTLSPSMPFHSKKNSIQDTPLLLAVRYCMQKLVLLLLEQGGEPAKPNGRRESSLHVLCGQLDQDSNRRMLLDVLVSWPINGSSSSSSSAAAAAAQNVEKVSVNSVDHEGNAAIHNAASNGLAECVQRLIQLGAIISLVNKANATCCELADRHNFKPLAHALELALVFQPEEEDEARIRAFSQSLSDYNEIEGKLQLDMLSLDTEGVDALVEAAVLAVSQFLAKETEAEMKKSQNLDTELEISNFFRARAEALLNSFNWDVDRLLQEYETEREKVLSAAKMDTSFTSPLLQKKLDNDRKRETLIDSEMKQAVNNATGSNSFLLYFRVFGVLLTKIF